MSIISILIESSMLYSLQPIGTKNELQESLTGYIARLAQKHLMDVGQLMNYELVPVLQKKYLNQIAIYGGSGFYNNASMINGIGEAAFDFVMALQKLTLRNELINCTLYPWHYVFPSRELMSSVKKWCPLCYQNALKENQDVYEQLLWALQPVNACPIHGIKLVTQCPNCKQQLRILDRHSKPGLCNKCNEWLSKHESIEKASERDVAISKQAENVLAVNAWAKNADVKYIRDFFQMCLNHFTGGIAEFSRFIGSPKTTVWGWCKGRNQPPFSKLLSICELLRVETVDVLLGRVREVRIERSTVQLVNNPEKVKVHRKKFVESEIMKSLEDCVSSESDFSPSMQQVARQQKVPKKVLEKHFPDLCKRISTKHLSFKCRQAANKKENRKAEIRKIFVSLSKQGIFPSRRKIEETASWKAALRNPDFQKEWKRLLYYIDVNHQT